MKRGRSERRRRSKRQRPTGSAVRPARAPALPPTDSRVVGSALAVIIALAGLVRLAATWNDLWLDEIWTLRLLGDVHSLLGVFTLRHENNHILNSLFMYAFRPFGIDWLYRVPDWLAGTAVVGLGAWVAWQGDGRPDRGDASPKTRALVTAVLLGGSYLLVHYASEARGYSLALAFGFLALGTALADGPRPMSRRAPVAWVSLVLAMLALALAVHFLIALIAWSAVRALRRGGWRDAAATLAWWYAVPVGFFALYYLGFLRVMGSAGGPREGVPAAVVNAIAGATGLPDAVPAPVLLALGIAVTAIGLVWLAARGSDLWTLYLFGMVVSPAVVAYAHRAELYVGRHFIVSMALWLLLAGRLLAWVASRSRRAGFVVAATLAAFLAVNAVRTVPLLRYGRGSFRDALRYMVSHTEGDAVRVTGDQDTRNRIVVEYYAPRIGADRPVRYVNRRDRTGPDSDWFIACLPPPHGGVPRVVADARGNRYRYEIEFPSNPFAGTSWRVYRAATARAGGFS
ncbi:MAG TPA: hypothetical protein VGS98_02675 [Thermoanaerobaculia bacterium]|nr:hypothetical protein [Thermoanaerobaculia bacterium]